MYRSILTLCLSAYLLVSPHCANASPIQTDPVGDTFGAGPVQLDITSYKGDRNDGLGVIQFAVNFSGTISPASALAPDSVVGFIEIDADQNPLTGNTSPLVNSFAGAPPFNLGSELFIDLGSEIFNAGFVDVRDAVLFNVLGTIPITYSANGFAFDLPLSFLPPGSSTFPNYAMVVGTLAEPTDRAPNGATPATVTPEPASIFAFGLIGITAASWTVRRRRQVQAA